MESVRTETPWGVWEPLDVAEAAAVFSGCGVPWWIAGGYAVELAVGRPYREHGDVDVLVLRRDQLVVQQVLSGWEWWVGDPPGTLRPWAPSELLPVGVHDIWCRSTAGEPWRLQAMLDEADDADWVSRRDARIRRPVREVGRLSGDGIPYLAPEIQLFYKAKHPRPKDEDDFAMALPVLSEEQRRWLAEATSTVYGQQHPWLRRL
jgi:hypothetical protein